VLESAMTATDPIARTIRSTHRQLDWQLDLQRALLHMALRDDLTGLHNRRGFIPLATGYLRWARDAGQKLVMFFADVDGLKSINDRFGHSEGDRAIARAAACIRETFRQSDVTARLSGDEFVALIIERRGRSAGTVCRRLQSKLAKCARAERRYSLSLNVGVAHFDPGKPVALYELMKQAEIALYRNQRRQRSAFDDIAAAPMIAHGSASQPTTPVV
jgi:diguanylate cyclase (GGDEF)-like protein